MIGDEIRNSVFRDTKSFYRQFPADVVARPLINFTKKHAGKEILDLGCATGNYCRCLGKLGYSVKGADVNAEYVATARERGVDAVLIEDAVPFPDRSFDTVLVFEVLEHLADPEQVIKEAKRLSRHNVLFTTPNSGGVERLQCEGLLFEHFADLDHKNFFTEESLGRLLRPHFARVKIFKGEGINPLALIGIRPLRLLGKALTKAGLVPVQHHFRLYAVAEM